MNTSPAKNSQTAFWFSRLQRAARSVWQSIREWCGDAAYESYLRSKHTKCGCGRPLTPAEFYVEQMDQKYSRPNRCC